MQTMQSDAPTDLRRTGRRFGYGVAIAVNVVMLFVVQNILDWGWFSFLTEEFSDVVPWISLSLGISILVNAVYLVDDRRVVKSTGQILINLVNIGVSYLILQVFPFDFSTYDFDWSIVARVVLIVAIVGSAFGAIAEVGKLVSGEPKKGGVVTS